MQRTQCMWSVAVKRSEVLNGSQEHVRGVDTVWREVVMEAMFVLVRAEEGDAHVVGTRLPGLATFQNFNP